MKIEQMQKDKGAGYLTLLDVTKAIITGNKCASRVAIFTSTSKVEGFIITIQ